MAKATNHFQCINKAKRTYESEPKALEISIKSPHNSKPKPSPKGKKKKADKPRQLCEATRQTTAIPPYHNSSVLGGFDREREEERGKTGRERQNKSQKQRRRA